MSRHGKFKTKELGFVYTSPWQSNFTFDSLELNVDSFATEKQSQCWTYLFKNILKNHSVSFRYIPVHIIITDDE